MKKSYTIEEIEQAAKNAAQGKPTGTDQELDQMGSRLARGDTALYLIGPPDLTAYLQQREGPEICDRRMPVFAESARVYIERSEGLSEMVGTCLDLAHSDAAETPCSCPAHDGEGDDGYDGDEEDEEQS